VYFVRGSGALKILGMGKKRGVKDMNGRRRGEEGGYVNALRGEKRKKIRQFLQLTLGRGTAERGQLNLLDPAPFKTKDGCQTKKENAGALKKSRPV